jgi:hypothetical protein
VWDFILVMVISLRPGMKSRENDLDFNLGLEHVHG